MAQKIAEGELNPITFKPYDSDCLEKLRYENQGVNFMAKKTSTYSVKETTSSSILKYCKPLDKKNPLEYKSTKARSIT